MVSIYGMLTLLVPQHVVFVVDFCAVGGNVEIIFSLCVTCE